MVLKNGSLPINLKMSNHCRCNKIYNSLCVCWLGLYSNHKYQTQFNYSHLIKEHVKENNIFNSIYFLTKLPKHTIGL